MISVWFDWFNFQLVYIGEMTVIMITIGTLEVFLSLWFTFYLLISIVVPFCEVAQMIGDGFFFLGGLPTGVVVSEAEKKKKKKKRKKSNLPTHIPFSIPFSSHVIS